MAPLTPPATSSLPRGSSTALMRRRALAIGVCNAKVGTGAVGSVSSVEARAALPSVVPPRISTLPEASSAPAWSYRAVLRAAPATKAPRLPAFGS